MLCRERRRKRVWPLEVQVAEKQERGGGMAELGWEKGVRWGCRRLSKTVSGVTGSSVDQQCRTDFCAPRYARDSFDLTTSVDKRFLFDALWRTQRGER